MSVERKIEEPERLIAGATREEPAVQQVTVIIPAVLAARAAGRRRQTVVGNDVREVLDNLEAEHHDLRGLLSRDGRLSRFMNVYVNEQNVRDGAGLDTRVSDGDEVCLVPAVAGG
jgi:molybdopterin converting factor small subunit